MLLKSYRVVPCPSLSSFKMGIKFWDAFVILAQCWDFKWSPWPSFLALLGFARALEVHVLLSVECSMPVIKGSEDRDKGILCPTHWKEQLRVFKSHDPCREITNVFQSNLLFTRYLVLFVPVYLSFVFLVVRLNYLWNIFSCSYLSVLLLHGHNMQ